MKSYLKLVNFELGRFFKIYLVLIAITVISQIAGVIVKSQEYLSKMNEAIYIDGTPQAQAIEELGTMSMMEVINSLWFLGPIALCIAGLIFYCFFIWYRDWFGKNTFIYRLLMLPTARLNILLAKASAIFLMVLGLVAIQIILLQVESSILAWMVPMDFRTNLTITEMKLGPGSAFILEILIPQSFIQFIINYGIGFMAVFILFTAILFERSYRMKGILFGVIYIILSTTIFLAPFIAEIGLQTNYFYPMEIFIIEIILGLLVIGMSIWLSNFLLNKKITV